MTPTLGAALFGRGIAFPPRLTADGRLAWSEGETNVREHIRLILATHPGERQRTPFGAGLDRFLFEPNLAATHAAIRQAVESAVTAWEPRVRVRSVDVRADAHDAGTAWVQLDLELVATQALERVSLAVPVAGAAAAAAALG